MLSGFLRVYLLSKVMDVCCTRCAYQSLSVGFWSLCILAFFELTTFCVFQVPDVCKMSVLLFAHTHIHTDLLNKMYMS